MLKAIEERLGQFRVEESGQDLIASKAIKQVTLVKERVQIGLQLGFPMASIRERFIHDLQAFLAPVAEGHPIDIQITTQIDAHGGKAGIPCLPGIKNIVAVASGKGGVGKSTVAVNVALALAKEGARVGLLDADIYGPSQPTMLGAANEKPHIENRTIQPIIRHGLQTMSVGYLVDANAAMVWRGPMLGKMLEQLMHDTQWDNLDYLIVDLPPGTGDVQLTLCQKMPVSGAIIVTTPQDMALLDVARACEMFVKLTVPILGVVENMSTHRCSQCGHEEALFGEGGGERLAAHYHTHCLGSIPLARSIREMTDSGEPPVVREPTSDYANAFGTIARRAAAQLSLQTKDYSHRFPKIVVEQAKKESKQ